VIKSHVFSELMMLDLFYHQFEKDVARLGLATDVTFSPAKSDDVSASL
jgi:hypothetical protein